MTSSTRRNLLKAMSALPFAARSAAKQAEEMVGAGVGKVAGYPGGEYGWPSSGDDYLTSLRTRIAQFVNNGLPEWKKRSMMREASRFRRLDPDIACLNSVSLSAKLRMQEAKNIGRLEREEIEILSDQVDRIIWEKGLGIKELY